MTTYLGKKLFILFAASAFRKLSSIYVFSYFPFGFEGRISDLIVSVPDHCLSFYFDYIRTHHKGKNLPSVHVLGDFNFKDIDWPDRLSKSGSKLSQSEGQILIDIMNDHGLEQIVHFPTREKNTLDLILTTLPCQFQDVFSPD